MTKKILLTILVLAVTLVGSVVAFEATKSSVRENGDKLQVTATYYPLYDFTKQVGGNKIGVTNMTPAGSEPHDFDPSPQALIAAHNSSVFVYNGEQMEPWVDSFLSDYKNTAVKASQDVSLLDASEDDHGDEGEDDHISGTTDPHFWLDPIAAQQMVNTIRDGLSEADPGNREYYTANAERYNEKLAELDKRYAEGLASCTLDTVISSHSAFSYLAHRYDFEVASIAGIEPDDEPSPAKIAELTNLVRQKGIRYVFFESLVSPRLAETIASEAGAQTMLFDPIEGLSQEDQNKGRDYLSVQYDNLENLRTALGCR